MFLTIPTLLTWARIVAIPLIVGVFYLPVDSATRNLIATVMFVVVARADHGCREYLHYAVAGAA